MSEMCEKCKSHCNNCKRGWNSCGVRSAAGTLIDSELFWPITAVCQYMGVSKASIFKLLADPKYGFPSPKYVKGLNRKFWFIDEVTRWLEENTSDEPSEDSLKRKEAQLRGIRKK